MSVRPALKRLIRSLPFKRPIFDALRKWMPLPHSVYQHLHFDGDFDVPIDATHRFRMHSYGTYVENELFWKGYGNSWEGRSLRVWSALCRDRAGLICDIGANTGSYALAAAALAPEARIAAFEPVARMADRLRRNVDLNDYSILVEQKAVSDRTGQLTIYDVECEHNYSASLEGQGPDASSYMVEVCTLDDYCEALGVSRLGPIKLDVERHEPAAIRGMLKSLAAFRPAMIVEILDEEIGRQVDSLIDGLDYLKFQIDEDRGLIPTDALKPLRPQHWNQLLCSRAEFEQAGLARFLA